MAKRLFTVCKDDRIPSQASLAPAVCSLTCIKTPELPKALVGWLERGDVLHWKEAG